MESKAGGFTRLAFRSLPLFRINNLYHAPCQVVTASLYKIYQKEVAMFDMTKSMKVKGSPEASADEIHENSMTVAKLLADAVADKYKDKTVSNTGTTKDVATIVTGALIFASEVLSKALPPERGLEYALRIVAHAYDLNMTPVDGDNIAISNMPPFPKSSKDSGIIGFVPNKGRG